MKEKLVRYKDTMVDPILYSIYPGMFRIEDLKFDGVDVSDLYSTYELRLITADAISDWDYDTAIFLLNILKKGTDNDIYYWDGKRYYYEYTEDLYGE